jgi:hypothetical protein
MRITDKMDLSEHANRSARKMRIAAKSEEAARLAATDGRIQPEYGK